MNEIIVKENLSENEISYIIRGAIFDVYNHFGPGLYENVYKEAMYLRIKSQNNVEVMKEFGIEASYMDKNLGLAYRLDLLVGNKVIVEVKSIELIADIHKKQLLTYLKLTGKKLGILVNFNTDKITTSIVRIVNKL